MSPSPLDPKLPPTTPEANLAERLSLIEQRLAVMAATPQGTEIRVATESLSVPVGTSTVRLNWNAPFSDPVNYTVAIEPLWSTHYGSVTIRGIVGKAEGYVDVSVNSAYGAPTLVAFEAIGVGYP